MPVSEGPLGEGGVSYGLSEQFLQLGLSHEQGLLKESTGMLDQQLDLFSLWSPCVPDGHSCVKCIGLIYEPLLLTENERLVSGFVTLSL